VRRVPSPNCPLAAAWPSPSASSPNLRCGHSYRWTGVVYGLPVCMACLCVWPVCVYGLAVCMTSLCVWPACVYGQSVVYWCMACLFTGLVYGLTGVVYGLSAQRVSPPSRPGAPCGPNLCARVKLLLREHEHASPARTRGALVITQHSSEGGVDLQNRAVHACAQEEHRERARISNRLVALFARGYAHRRTGAHRCTHTQTHIRTHVARGRTQIHTRTHIDTHTDAHRYRRGRHVNK
jgi:hypothetical protein